MWTDQKSEFIESAARTMWADAWAANEQTICYRCGDPEYIDDAESEGGRAHHDLLNHPYPFDDEEVSHPFEVRSFAGRELTEVAPPTPDYARLAAAVFLGKLEQANGCDLAVIVEAARKAECATGACNQFGAAADADRTHPGAYQHGPDCVIDVAEFASDLIMEALGHGVSWFDDHENFWLGDGRTIDTAKGRLRIPRIEFEYLGEDER